MLRAHGIEIPAGLEPPECPPELAHLMDWFDELRAWGRQALQGVHNIVWTDADAWARRMQVAPRPSEWRLLMQLDNRFRAAAAKHKPADKPGRRPPVRPGR